MSLEQLLRLIRASSLILLGNARVWGGSTHVPLPIKQAVCRYRRELAWKMKAHHWDVCPTPDLHRREVYYRTGEWICGAGERLEEWIA
jgi:hypothetical protein